MRDKIRLPAQPRRLACEAMPMRTSLPRASTQIVSRAGDAEPGSRQAATSTCLVAIIADIDHRCVAAKPGGSTRRDGLPPRRPRPVPIDSLPAARLPAHEAVCRSRAARRSARPARLDHARPRPLGGRRTMPRSRAVGSARALRRRSRPASGPDSSCSSLCSAFPVVLASSSFSSFFFLPLTPSFFFSLSSYLPNHLPHHHTPPTSLVLSFLCS